MKNHNPEILLKLLWITLTLFTIYVFVFLTFVEFTLGKIGTEKYNLWNLLIPNILTIGLLILYAKEVVIGYTAKSIHHNLKSLLIFSILIISLVWIQAPKFKLLFNNSKSEIWQITLSLVIVLTSYVGIILNRILKIKELKNRNQKV